MNYDNKTQTRVRQVIRDKLAESNIVVAKTMLVFACVSFAVLLLFALEIIKSESRLINTSLVVIPVLFTISGMWCLVKKGNGRAFQYIFFALLSAFWLALELMSGYKTKMLLPILVIMSLRYYDKGFTMFNYVQSSVVLMISVFCNAYLYKDTGFIDLNLVSFETPVTTLLDGFIYNDIISLSPSSDALLKNGLRLSFVPNFIILTLTTFVATRFMNYNLDTILQFKDIADKEAEAQTELANMKTKVMLSQIKPHFIYNALSSIAMYCTENPQKAQELTLDFSDYLRNNLDSLDDSSSGVCTFETELNHIKSYLNIEKSRFEDRLNVEYDIENSDFDVPTLSIQPIVENAVKHGVCKKKEGGTVKITTSETLDEHLITISDDGVGFDKNAVIDDGKVHVGIQNIEKRIAMFGGRVEIDSTVGAGTTVTVYIPKGDIKA